MTNDKRQGSLEFPSPADDRPAPFVRESDTSRLAAADIRPSAGQLRVRVLGYVASFSDHGATCNEVERALGMLHQSASARIRELVQGGYLTDSTKRRDTIYGRKAVVWVPTDLGLLETGRTP
jgi:hypothetical protein